MIRQDYGQKNRLPWALYHGERSGIKLHVSFTNRTWMPLQIVETTVLKHDGPIGVELDNKRFILVADRAYYSIDKVDRYTTTNQDFIIRLKGNIQLNRKKSLKEPLLKSQILSLISHVHSVLLKNKPKNDIVLSSLPITKERLSVLSRIFVR